MGARNVLRQTKQIIYRLKRNYGLEMSLRYRTAADQYNLSTGAITLSTINISIRRGILLPQRIITDFIYDLSFIAANKNFTYGGDFQQGVRFVILDAKDLPANFVINNEMFIIFNNRKYEIVENMKSEDGYAWLLKAKQVMATTSEA